MIPLRLRLRNFMSYGLEGGDIDLRHIHLACLSGSNGHGKSTLVDAITWALWGKSRAAREDDLLRHGTSEMEVEFEFATGGSVYRVIRKRVQRKSTSSTVLELAVRDGDVYRAITGGSVYDTERLISSLLRLSYEIFINSSLLLQGKADLFTVKPPRERKEVLAEILGVGQYERLAERARERKREYEAEVDRLTLRIDELDRFITDLPAVQEALAASETELTAIQQRRTDKESAVADIEARLGSVRTLQETLDRHQTRLAELAREEARITATQEAAVRARDAAVALLADEATLRAGLAELQQARAANDTFSEQLARLHVLNSQALEHQRVCDFERSRLDQECSRAVRALQDARAAAARAVERRPELERLRADTAALPRLLEERERLRKAEGEHIDQCRDLQADCKAIEQQMEEQRKRIKQLRSAGADCPVCGSALTEAGRAAAEQEKIAEGLRCKVELHKQTARLQEQERALQEIRLTSQRIEQELTRLQQLGPREGRLEQEIRTLEEQAAQEPGLQCEVERLQTLLASEAYAQEARTALAAIEHAIGQLGYDASAHERITQRIRALATIESRLSTLDAAKEALQGAQGTLESCAAQLTNFGKERAHLEAECATLWVQTGDVHALQVTLAERRQELESVRLQEGELQQRQGKLQRQIEDGQAKVIERNEALATQQAANTQVWVHKELDTIFGKRGIQAMLIENALPELEEDANDLLSRMTDNSTQVQFTTQRQSRTGNAIETLDIKIADSMGTRSYEMFSGGEAFRINLAIRIALSRLLARRAGAQLSFLLIDEGFGTQDTQGRDKLVEAISAIADDFEKILVVTHIDELKDMFDVHIEVTKGPEGSRVSVSAA